MRTRLVWLAQTGVAASVVAATAPALIETVRNESPEAAASHELNFHRSAVISKDTIDKLNREHFVVIDNVIEPEALQAARSDFMQLQTSGFLRPTGQHGPTRSDAIGWITEGDKTLQQAFGLRHALRRLRGLALQIESAAGGSWAVGDGAAALGVPPGAQLACYPRAVTEGVDPARAATGGARYIAHRDGVERRHVGLLYALMEPAHCMREISCILYLTEAATEAAVGGGGLKVTSDAETMTRVLPEASAAAAGALVLHLGADAHDTSGAGAHTLVEILPVGGRLVLFDSRTVLHEVRPHSRADIDRVAMTLWLGGPHDALSLLRFCSAWWLPRAWM